MPWLGSQRAVLMVLDILQDHLGTNIDNLETELGITDSNPVPAPSAWFAHKHDLPRGESVQVEVYENGAVPLLDVNTYARGWLASATSQIRQRVPIQIRIRHLNRTAITYGQMTQRTRVYEIAALRCFRGHQDMTGTDSAVSWVIPTQYQVMTEDAITDDSNRLRMDTCLIDVSVDLAEVGDGEGVALAGDDAWMTGIALETLV